MCNQTSYLYLYMFISAALAQLVLTVKTVNFDPVTIQVK